MHVVVQVGGLVARRPLIVVNVLSRDVQARRGLGRRVGC